MQRFQASIVIHFPIEAVFVYITDMERFKQGVAVFRSKHMVVHLDEAGGNEVDHALLIPPLRQVTEGPLQLGTIFVQSNGAPRPMEATIEVIEYKPPHIITIKQTSALVKGSIRWRLEPVNGETRLIQTVEAEAQGAFAILFSLFSFFGHKSAQQQLDQALLSLKQKVEGHS